MLRENLYNTNSEFDWGPFRQLEEELTLSWTPPTLFSLVLSQPGVYVFRLSSQRHKHMVTNCTSQLPMVTHGCISQ